MTIELNIYRARIGLHHYRHSKVKGLGTLNNFELVTFLAMLLYQSGDIEKNPGPNSASSTESDDSFQFPPLQGNLFMVHYNVQSLASKTDIIEPELTNFDIISLTETWLNDSISNEDLKFNEFQDPFRRDRVGDSHGGVIVYVKRGIPCKRRLDLELVNIECVWIEIIVKNKKLLIEMSGISGISIQIDIFQLPWTLGFVRCSTP